MSIRLKNILKWLYQFLPLPPKIKNRLKIHIIRFISINVTGRMSVNRLRRTLINPAIARAEDLVERDALKFHGLDSPPKVSIIIPVYNNIEYTVRCLSSILIETTMKDYEIIVVDDCSTDETQDRLAEIENIKYIKNDINSGFIVSCNNGAEHASGEYLIFLNNDTIVLQAWLESILEVFAEKKDAGLVGSMLLYPDGRLQEAGGIVWQDANAWNYGHMTNPRLPEYNYLRKVDYCSGACIGIKEKLFSELGGFDRIYIPAYYEDTDIAFRIREKGYSVYYQPQSKIIHFEGVSSGVDLTSGTKRYQLINQTKFYDRWKDVLLSHGVDGLNVMKERDRYAVKRILVLDASVLTPDQDSGSLRMYTFLSMLVEQGMKVVFIADNLVFDEKYTPRLQALGVEMIYSPFTLSIVKYLKSHGDMFDSVLLSRVYVADAYLESVRKYCPKAKVIFDTVDLHFIRERRQAEIHGDKAMMKAAIDQRDVELSLVRKSDVTLVVSDTEKEILHNELKNDGVTSDARVEVLSNIHLVHGTDVGFDERKNILFIGGFNHEPNVDAVLYFCEEILPLIRERNPDIELLVIGSDMPKVIADLEGEGVRIIGYVDDIEPWFSQVRLSVAPLRYGAGVKGKINSSMSYGVPVVSTAIGVEGMCLNADEVMQADEPESFAEAVLSLYGDRDLWNRISEGGMRNVERNYSPARAGEIIPLICDTGET